MSLGTTLIKAVLIDITGVLYESGTKVAIPGSIEAISKLEQFKIPFKFVTNETQNTRKGLLDKLAAFGFNGLTVDQVFAPAPAVRNYLEKNGLRPHYLIHPLVEPEFDGLNSSNANCVVVGDASDHFSYDNVNKAFQLLMAMDNPILISMGKGRFYQDKGELVIDLGAYAAALEYATDTKAVVIGKPAEQFFVTALEALQCPSPEYAVMIGDDLTSDVGGAQRLGIRGVQVRTGKFRPGRDDCHPTIKPDAIVDNLLGAINLIIETNQLIK